MANAKTYEDLTFTDDFMFCKVMTTNPELCHELPELVLGDESTKIFLCAGGNADDVSDDMKDFLNWLTTE